MANASLNTKQKLWLKSFLAQYPYYKLRRITEGLGGDRVLLLEGMESLPLPLIREFEGARSGYRFHTLSCNRLLEKMYYFIDSISFTLFPIVNDKIIHL